MLKVAKEILLAGAIWFIGNSLTAAPIKLLDGWQFAKGNHPPNSNDASWQAVKLPERFSSQEDFTNYRGWLTLKKILPGEINDWKKQGTPLAIRTGTISDVVELYINDHLIERKGSVEPYVPGLYQLILADIPAIALTDSTPNYIVLKIFSDGEKPFHVTSKTFDIGPANEIYRDYYYNEITQFTLLGIYLVVGLYHLLLAIKRKKEVYNFYFGAFCVLVSFYWFLFTGSRDLLFGQYQILRTKIEYAVVFLLPATLLFFLSYLFKRNDKKINRYFHRATIIYTIFVGSLALLVIFGPYHVMQINLKIWQLSLPLVLIAFISFVTIEAFRRNKDAQYLIGGTAILLSGVLFDLLIALNVIQAERIAQYSFLAFVLAIAAILANRFVRVHNQVEELNASLELKVRDRTRELEQTLNEVKSLKEQQDGDYFLISLLLSPLSENNNQSKTVLIDTYIRQKKQFHFRRWSREIGGDMNIAHTITLRDRECSVFINADAMGKSLQGAGGALVLGAVFLSIIERSRISPNEKKKSPEQWIRDAFIEMQKVFESFDGSMLISMVFGIIEAHSGLMYLMNAEHPLPVLYRDGKASFIESDIIFRKLGSSVVHGQIQIQTFQLHSGDVVILGSDGRDDLLIAGDTETEKIVNEDEKQFLLRVEEGKGVLENIVAAIERSGELYDDLSLMRIQFDPEHNLQTEYPAPTVADMELLTRIKELSPVEISSEIISLLEKRLQDKSAPSRLMREAVKIYTRLQSYDKAAEVITRLLEIHPTESEFFVAASYIFHKQGNREKAIDYGERLRLRNPRHRKNLLQLAEIWYETGNTSRSRQLLHELMQVSHTREDRIISKARELLGRIEFTGQES